MPMTALVLAIFLALHTASVALETPDPRIAERFSQAQAELATSARCDSPSSCDDVALQALALSAVGTFPEARAALQQSSIPTPLWVLANYAYWTASADEAFLRAQWPALATSLFAPPTDRIISDGGLELAAADAVLAMARELEDSATVERVEAIYAFADHRAQQRSGVMSAALGMINADRADALITQLADTVHARYPLATGLVAWALYEQHREAEGYGMLRRMLNARGQGALFTLPMMRGLIGWETDAPNRAVSIEPHLPAEWSTMRVSGLVAGRDTLSVGIRRQAGVYTVELRRQRAAPVLAVQLAPALPRAARVRHVKINDVDAPIQVDATRYDTHVIIELGLRREATIEIEYDAPVRRTPSLR